METVFYQLKEYAVDEQFTIWKYRKVSDDEFDLTYFNKDSTNWGGGTIVSLEGARNHWRYTKGNSIYKRITSDQVQKLIAKK